MFDMTGHKSYFQVWLDFTSFEILNEWKYRTQTISYKVFIPKWIINTGFPASPIKHFLERRSPSPGNLTRSIFLFRRFLQFLHHLLHPRFKDMIVSSSCERFRLHPSLLIIPRTAAMDDISTCPCVDCEDVRDGRQELILQLNVILPLGQGCPFRRGCRTMQGMLLQWEQQLDHRLISRSLKKLVDNLRLCVDPITSRTVWSMCQHFRVDDSPISGIHELGLDYHYDENNNIMWAIGPMNNDLSKSRKEDVRTLRRLGLEGFVVATGDLPITRLDRSSWDWESQQWFPSLQGNMRILYVIKYIIAWWGT